MKVLIAEDDEMSQRLLQAALAPLGHELVQVRDGRRAWKVLRESNDLPLALIDWMMPAIDGVEICRRLRRRESPNYTYVILVTARDHRDDILAGLRAGADDYVTKPYDLEELRCRVRTAERILELQSRLTSHIGQLRALLAHVKKLQGLLPICMHCKSVRDDQNTWHGIERYIEEHSDAMFTHSLCRSCLQQHYPEFAEDE